MAPERFEGWSDRRSDVYSLGATLYELLTLRPLFGKAAQAELIDKVIHDAPDPPRKLDHKLPRDLETIVLKAIAKEPGDRYPTAQALAADLGRFLEDRPVLARRSTPVEQFWRWCRRNPWLAAANITAATLTTILAIVSTLAAWSYRNQRNQITGQRDEIGKAEIQGRERLFEALTAQARAMRSSQQMGQRFDSLKALAKASTIARELKLPPERLDPLRDEAIAALALPDLEPTGRDVPRPWGVVVFAFDATMTRYALRFSDGTISVRRVADDGEVARFQARGNRDIWVLDFSPDGRYLATTHSPGGGLTVWEIDRRAIAVEDPGHIWRGAKFSPDSRRIAVAARLATSSSMTWQPVGPAGPGPGRRVSWPSVPTGPRSPPSTTSRTPPPAGFWREIPAGLSGPFPYVRPRMTSPGAPMAPCWRQRATNPTSRSTSGTPPPASGGRPSKAMTIAA